MRTNRISGLLAFSLLLLSGLSGGQDKPANTGLLTLERI